MGVTSSTPFELVTVIVFTDNCYGLVYVINTLCSVVRASITLLT